MTSLFIDPTAMQRSAGDSTPNQRIDQAAQQFEALLLKEIVKHAVPKMESSGMAGETFSDMLATELAGTIAATGQTGLSKIIAEQMGQRSGGGAPVSAKITSEFGDRVHPVTGERHHHDGVDVAVPVGTQLVAPDAGVVSNISRNDIGGLSLTLDHGKGRTSTYRHLDQVDVAAGERLGPGQRFATTGASGRVTGPHLHLEVRQRGTTIDPRPWVDRVFSKEVTR